MAKYPGLFRRKGTYCLRVHVPKRIAGVYGKREVVRSLLTKNKAEALSRYHGVAKVIRDELAGYDLKAEPIADRHLPNNQHSTNQKVAAILGNGELISICDGHYQRLVDLEFEWQTELYDTVMADKQGFADGKYIKHPETEWYLCFYEDMTIDEQLLQCIKEHRMSRKARVEQDLALGNVSDHQTAADRVLQERGWVTTDADKLRLTRKLMETEIAVLDELLRSDNSRYNEILEKYQIHASAHTGGTELQAVVANPLSFDPGPALSTLVEPFLAEGKREGLAAKTTMGDKTDLREFLDVVGDKPIRSYTKFDGVKFKSTLIATPAQRKTRPFQGLNMAQAAQQAEQLDAARQQIPRLHQSTINDKILVVQKFFKWADTHYGEVPNPVDGLRIKAKRVRNKAGAKRYPFTVEELQTLFDGPVYRGYQSSRKWKISGELIPRDSARFWAPLIALYTGMRLGEIIQLRVTDVKTDSAGITYFDISETAEDDSLSSPKSLKNANSTRQVPVHPMLFEIGLNELIVLRQKERAPRLFMDYDCSPTDGSWSKTFSSWFRHYRKHLGVERIVGGKDRVVFHSFRHLFEDVVRDLPDVKKEVRDALQGHGENGVSAEYGTGVYRRRLQAAIEKVEFPGLDLSHLIVNPAPSASQKAKRKPVPATVD